MPITYLADFKGQNSGVSAAITSNVLSVNTGDHLVIIAGYDDNPDSTAWLVSNNGSSILWNQIADTNTTGNCRLVMWQGIAGAVPPNLITVTSTAGGATTDCKSLAVFVHRGYHASNPVPLGNIYTGVGLTDASRTITPSSAGSTLWMFCGDWNATNTFASTADNTLVGTFHQATQATFALIRPTTQPRPDSAAFSLGETDTGGLIAYIAFEVVSEPVAGTPAVGNAVPLLDAKWLDFNARGQSWYDFWQDEKITSGSTNGNALSSGYNLTLASGNTTASGTTNGSAASIGYSVTLASGNTIASSATNGNAIASGYNVALANGSVSASGTANSTGIASGYNITLTTGNSSSSGTTNASATIAGYQVALESGTANASGTSTSNGNAVSSGYDLQLTSSNVIASTSSQAATGGYNVTITNSNSTASSSGNAQASTQSYEVALSASSSNANSTSNGNVPTSSFEITLLSSDASGSSSSEALGICSGFAIDIASSICTATGTSATVELIIGGVGRKSKKKQLTYADRKLIDEEIYDILYGIAAKEIKEQKAPKSIVTPEFISNISLDIFDNVDLYTKSLSDIKTMINEHRAMIKSRIRQQKRKKDEEILLLY